MRFVLDRNGRILLNVPGPKLPLVAIMTEAFARHVSPQAATFADVVFGLRDPDAIAKLFRDAGFSEVNVYTRPKPPRPPAGRSLLAVLLQHADHRAGFKGQHRAAWRARTASVRPLAELVRDGALPVELGMTNNGKDVGPKLRRVVNRPSSNA